MNHTFFAKHRFHSFQPNVSLISFGILFLFILSCKSKSKQVSVAEVKVTPELLATFSPADRLVAVERTIPVTGTPFTLNYRSDRQAGAIVNNVIPIALVGENVPKELKKIKLEISVVDKKITEELNPTPNLTYHFVWDKRDAKGNEVKGAQTAKLKVGLQYSGQDTAKWSEKTITLGDWDARSFGLGGWSISEHHIYDGRKMYRGDGEMQMDIGTPLNPDTLSGEIFVPSREGDKLYIFDKTGRHLRTMNSLTGSRVYEFKYGINESLTSIEDAFGNLTRIQRNNSGDPVAIIAPYGQKTELKKNNYGYLVAIIDPAGNSTEFEYTPWGLLTNVREPMGPAAQYEYDGLGRVTKTGSEKATSTMTRKMEGGESKLNLSTPGMHGAYAVDISSGTESVHSYKDSAGAEFKIQMDHKRNTKTINYPDGSRMVARQQDDPRWKMRSPVTYDMTLYTPAARDLHITRDQKITLENPNNPLTLKTSTETINISGSTYTRVYDKDKKEIATTMPSGRQRIETIDQHGRMVKVQNTGAHPINYTYDTRGKLTGISQESRSITIVYGADGQIASITDPLKKVLRFEYDKAGRVSKQVLADGSTIAFSYDANGNPVSITPPGRSAHSFSYTASNQPKEYTPPSDKPTSYTYDASNRLTTITRPGGATTIEYDNAGLPGTISFAGGKITREYDPKTRLLTSSTTADGISITYNREGFLLTGLNWSGAVKGTVYRGHDNHFRINDTRVNGDQINMSYDPDGLLLQAGELSFSYDPQQGLPTGSRLGNITSTRAYNGFGEITRLTAMNIGSNLFDVQYERNAMGRITKKTEMVDGQNTTYEYAYDAAGRLSSVTKNGAAHAKYQYDNNGNRTSAPSTGSPSTGSPSTGSGQAQYDGQDRMTRYGDATFTYSPNGDLSTKVSGGKTDNYTYDGMGNLRAVSLADGTKIEYLIDGDNRRIGKKVNGNLVQGFLWQDSLQIAAELDGQNNLVSRFVYAEKNVPEYMIKSGKTYRIISDHLGSPRLVVDVTTGAIAQKIEYDEFGNIISDSNPGFQPFGFSGGFYDQHTKLTRFGRRDYNASFGRWTAKDPILFRGEDANLYAYAKNDPINRSDWNGTVPGNRDWYDLTLGIIFGTSLGAGVATTVIFQSIGWAALVPPVAAAGFGLAGGVMAGTIFNHAYQYVSGQSLGEDWADINLGGPETFADWWYHFRHGYSCGLGYEYHPDTGECVCDNWDEYWESLCPNKDCAGLPCGR